MTTGAIDGTWPSLQVRERVIRELADIQEERGRIPVPLVREYAPLLGVHPDHVRRIVRQFRSSSVLTKPDSKKKKMLPDETAAKVAFFKNNGDTVETHAELVRQGLDGGMVLRTFQRRVLEWDACLRACARGGHREMVKRQFYNREHQPYRTYAYGTDHTKLPIRVIPERGSKPVFPWLSVLMDLKSRVIIAYVITTHDPVTDDTLALLAEGIRGREVEERGFLGGMPEFLRTDRGSDYMSKALGLGLIRLDIEHQFTEAYSSWQNGRVERIHGTIDTKFAPKQVGFQAGGEDEYTKRVRRAKEPTSTLDGVATLTTAFGAWVEEYNNTPHSALNGKSPYDGWFGDTHPVKQADHVTVAHALMRSKPLSLQKYGIDFKKHVYSSSSLAPLFDQGVDTVEVRWYVNDDSVIEVFHDGEWVCTATVTEKQSDNEKVGIVSHRRAQVGEATELAAQANYEKALDHQEDLRRRGVPESDHPTLPPKPGTKKEPKTKKPIKAKQDWEKPVTPAALNDIYNAS